MHPALVLDWVRQRLVFGKSQRLEDSLDLDEHLTLVSHLVLVMCELLLSHRATTEARGDPRLGASSFKRMIVFRLGEACSCANIALHELLLALELLVDLLSLRFAQINEAYLRLATRSDALIRVVNVLQVRVFARCPHRPRAAMVSFHTAASIAAGRVATLLASMSLFGTEVDWTAEIRIVMAVSGVEAAPFLCLLLPGSLFWLIDDG